jgi:hypothetical protein
MLPMSTCLLLLLPLLPLLLLLLPLSLSLLLLQNPLRNHQLLLSVVVVLVHMQS